MSSERSAVLEFGVPEPGETSSMMEDKLRFHTDSWDLSVDLEAGSTGIGVIDARGHDAYAAGHIPGAISFPHREMSVETTANLDRSIVYVVYCDGIGCNGRVPTSSHGWGSAPKSCSAASIGGAATDILSLLRASPGVCSPRRNSGRGAREVELRCRRFSSSPIPMSR